MKNIILIQTLMSTFIFMSCGKTTTFEGHTNSITKSLESDQKAAVVVTENVTVTKIQTSTDSATMPLINNAMRLSLTSDLLEVRKPLVKVVMVVDVSQSMSDKYSKIVSAFEKALNDFSGYNVEFMLFPASPSRLIKSVIPAVCSLTTGETVKCPNNFSTGGWASFPDFDPQKEFSYEQIGEINPPLNSEKILVTEKMSASDKAGVVAKFKNTLNGIVLDSTNNVTTDPLAVITHLVGKNEINGQPVFSPDDKVAFIVVSDEDEESTIPSPLVSAPKRKFKYGVEGSLGSFITVWYHYNTLSANFRIQKMVDGVAFPDYTRLLNTHVAHCKISGLCSSAPAYGDRLSGACTEQQLNFLKDLCSRDTTTGNKCLQVETDPQCKFLSMWTSYRIYKPLENDATCTGPFKLNGVIYTDWQDAILRSPNTTKINSLMQTGAANLYATGADYVNSDVTFHPDNGLCKVSMGRTHTEQVNYYSADGKSYNKTKTPEALSFQLSKQFKKGNVLLTGLINDPDLNSKTAGCKSALESYESYGTLYKKAMALVEGNPGQVTPICANDYLPILHNVKAFVENISRNQFVIANLSLGRTIAAVYLNKSTTQLSADKYTFSDGLLTIKEGVLKPSDTVEVEIK